MALFRRALGVLFGLFRKRQAERELDDELREYLAMAIEERMSAGMSREEAVRAARVGMGSVEAVKDRVRDVGWDPG